MAWLAGPLLVIAVACGSDDQSSDELVPGVSIVEITDRDHVDGDVEYSQSPPIGGNHNGAWINCGVYREPVPDENAVHTLEHGAVWITYDESVDADQIATLEALAGGQTHVLVTPYPGQSRPVIATAWGVQKGYDDADDPAITEFLRAFQEGPQTPEPGAPCTSGIGTPL